MKFQERFFTRRELLHRTGMGMGAVALAGLLGDTGVLRADRSNSSVNPLAPKAPPFPAKAKRVLHLFMNGGPSHVDTFDPKPSLARYAGKLLPRENLKTERKTGAAFPSPFKFERLEALAVISQSPELLADLDQCPALTLFLAAHVALRGTIEPRWSEINAVYGRGGLFGVLEWLGLPASPQT